MVICVSLLLMNLDELSISFFIERIYHMLYQGKKKMRKCQGLKERRRETDTTIDRTEGIECKISRWINRKRGD